MNKKLRRFCRNIWKSATNERYDRLALRATEAIKIAELAEHGWVAVVTSGMDCDGTAWYDEVFLVAASVVAVESWVAREERWADGPWSCRLERPSVAAKLAARHVDRSTVAVEIVQFPVIYA